jgi:hypothetical protein
MPPPSAIPAGGSVQQGLSAAGGALGFYQLGLAAEQRYSLETSLHSNYRESRAMTKFWRERFMRTSVYGNTHWVEGHWVERDDWDRDSSSGNLSSYYLDRLADIRADRSATACFVNPNADCPVCGQPVFFYQNHSGSRVYFDELGPPWPKHPCTDQDTYTRSPESFANTIVQPSVREASQVPLIDSWQSLAGIDTPYSFWEKYGTSQWGAWRVAGRFRGSNGALLVLNSVDTTEPRRQYFSARHLPKSFAIQALVFVYRGWLTYFDYVTMEPVAVEVQRIAGASGFVEELVKKRARKSNVRS